MCGIGGLLFRDADRPVESSHLDAIAGSMVHRGPDDVGSLLDGSFGLTMRRLSVIDLACGHQPIWNETRTVAVVLNGEIYNHKELRADLTRRGHRFDTGSDAESIVHLYEELGPTADLPARLHGMFAFTLYDAERKLAFLARDRVGKKPLYLYRDAAVLAFASEIDALFAPALPFDRTIDAEALDAYFATQYVCGPQTVFRNVRQLPPASHLILERRGAAWVERPEARYWSLPASPVVEGPPWRSFPQAVAGCEAELRRAVRQRLMSDVPLGVLLSGGLDSSLVAAMVTRESGPRVRTYSIGFDDPRLDETEAALRVARYLGTEHRSIVMPSLRAEDLVSIIRRTDQPLADPAVVPTWYLSRLAREGVTVALSGEGADEIFGGYHWYRGKGNGTSQAQALYARREQAAPALRRSLIAADLTARPDGLAQDSARGSYLAAGADEGALPRIAALQAIDLRSVLADDLLVKADRMSMAWSLEVRCPYLDHRVIEAVLPGPDRWKIRWGRRKALLREVSRRYLPPDVARRKKHGFMIPIDTLLRTEFAGMLGDLTSPLSLARHSILSAPGVASLLERWKTDPSLAKSVWKVLCLETWLEAHRAVPVR